MSLYQRKRLSTGEDVGDPAPLPADLVGGLTDEDLARLGEIVPPEAQAEYGDAAFVPVADPPPPTPRWIHKALFKRRFTADERIAIRAAAAGNAQLFDFMDLLDSTDEVNLDDAEMIAGLQDLVALGLVAAERPAEIRA